MRSIIFKQIGHNMMFVFRIKTRSNCIERSKCPLLQMRQNQDKMLYQATVKDIYSSVASFNIIFAPRKKCMLL